MSMGKQEMKTQRWEKSILQRLRSKTTNSSTYIGRVKLSCISNATSHVEDGGEAQSKARKVFSGGCFQLLLPLT